MDPAGLHLRSGIVGTNERDEEAADNFVTTAMGLLQVFAEESMRTAAQYCKGIGAAEVTDRHVCKALKYQCRTFFNNTDRLEERVQAATEKFWEQMEEAEREEDRGPSPAAGAPWGASGASTGAKVTTAEVTPEATSTAACKKVVRNVDLIAATWHRFEPADKVQHFIKTAIDQTQELAPLHI